MSKPRITEEQWFAHYQRAQDANQSLSGYAAAAKLEVSSFYSAINRLREKGLIEKAKRTCKTTSPFVKAKVTPMPQDRNSGVSVSITLPSTMRIEIEGSDPAAIVKVITLLQETLDHAA